jgi:hypothetical protein
MVYICIGMIIKVYRYQSGIQRLYIREGQIMQWEKKKEKKTSNDLQNTTQKTKD